MVESRSVVVLGGGVAGLAAASSLGGDAVVFEREDRPGGLVRTDCIDGYWFDHVLHLLHFQDEAMEARMRALLGDTLVRLDPEAWVETAHGTVRFPLQNHLAGLEPEVVVRCVHDYVEAAHARDAQPPRHFEDMLLRSFGRALCDVFLFPYNRKLWKRPLDTLAPTGFQWNIARPDLTAVIRGAVDPAWRHRAYNSNGWYPRPPAGAPVRGMEVMARALAATVSDLRLAHSVESVDLDARRVTVSHRGHTSTVHYTDACVATLPLPRLIDMAKGVPAELSAACATLPQNRVTTVMLRVRGPRPRGTGLWRYYADESIVFTRLIFLNEFDPLVSPDDGWALMAEIPEPAEFPQAPARDVIARTLRDVERAGALPPGCVVLGADVRVLDPAYVVFTLGGREIVQRAVEFLQSRGVAMLGRYGRWEYSSMSQVMHDGFEWAARMQAGRSA